MTPGRAATLDVAPAARPSRVDLYLGITVLLAAALVPLVADAYVVQVGTTMLLYMVLCLGLNVVVGYAGLLDLGYAAFFAVGAYTSGILTTRYGVNFWLTLPVAVVAACFAGVIIGAPTLRLRSDYLAIVTLGFGEIIQIVANNATGLTNGPQGVYNLDTPSVFGYRIDSSARYYYLLVVLCVLAVVVVSRLASSRIGRAWAAIREDEDAARAAGINTVRMKLLAFCIGAMIGGLAGPVFAANEAFVSPVSFSLDQSILVLAMVVLGGMGSVRGVIVGAAILVLVPEFLRSYAAARFIVVGAIMVLMMIVRPEGLLPSRIRSLEIHRRRRVGASAPAEAAEP